MCILHLLARSTYIGYEEASREMHDEMDFLEDKISGSSKVFISGKIQ